MGGNRGTADEERGASLDGAERATDVQLNGCISIGMSAIPSADLVVTAVDRRRMEERGRDMAVSKASSTDATELSLSCACDAEEERVRLRFCNRRVITDGVVVTVLGVDGFFEAPTGVLGTPIRVEV